MIKILNDHIPCGFSINVVSSNGPNKLTYYRGDNAVSIFCKKIRAIAYEKFKIHRQQTNKLTSDEQKEYEKATYCHICKKVFGANKKHRKVYDYDYYTGNYRGAAYSICNLRYSSQKDIPVFFHNGSNYDFNLIIAELAKEFRSELQCIPVNTNKCLFE